MVKLSFLIMYPFNSKAFKAHVLFSHWMVTWHSELFEVEKQSSISFWKMHIPGNNQKLCFCFCVVDSAQGLQVGKFVYRHPPKLLTCTIPWDYAHPLSSLEQPIRATHSVRTFTYASFPLLTRFCSINICEVIGKYLFKDLSLYATEWEPELYTARYLSSFRLLL